MIGFGVGQDFFGCFLITLLHRFDGLELGILLIFGQLDLGFGRVLRQFSLRFSRVFSGINFVLCFVGGLLFSRLKSGFGFAQQLLTGGLVDVLSLVDGRNLGIAGGFSGINFFVLLVGSRFDRLFFGSLSGIDGLLGLILSGFDSGLSGIFSRFFLAIGILFVARQLLIELFLFFTARQLPILLL
ncbi:hypothetical protein M0L20_18190 [Spirosoma sp. RP8]|uniref:Uncharacterized protein n=1 Tax=Spirosoma liriopis TaxID=2937440 RepID=A0ABT0HNQ6_9BACT|nr:hypothetical protein [Spirosoma liriopis]MCK8493802.1 hypothetical protein [Spirosoma liriopis]